MLSYLIEYLRDKIWPLNLPMPSPFDQSTGGPVVIPLIFGHYESIDAQSGKFRIPSTVTLIRDDAQGRCDILVDAGLPKDKNIIIGGKRNKKNFLASKIFKNWF